MYRQTQSYYPTAQSTMVNGIPPFAPFNLQRVIYTTRCSFSLYLQYAVLLDSKRIEVFCYDRFGSMPWTISNCRDCVFAVQQAVRQLGYSNPFICGELASRGTPEPFKQLNLPTNAPFSEDQVISFIHQKSVAEDYYMILRPDSLITIYTYNIGSGSWFMRIPQDVFNRMSANLKERNIRNAMLDMEVTSVTTSYVQGRTVPRYTPAQSASAQVNYASMYSTYNPPQTAAPAPTQQASTQQNPAMTQYTAYYQNNKYLLPQTIRIPPVQNQQASTQQHSAMAEYTAYLQSLNQFQQQSNQSAPAPTHIHHIRPVTAQCDIFPPPTPQSPAMARYDAYCQSRSQLLNRPRTGQSASAPSRVSSASERHASLQLERHLKQVREATYCSQITDIVANSTLSSEFYPLFIRKSREKMAELKIQEQKAKEAEQTEEQEPEQDTDETETASEWPLMNDEEYEELLQKCRERVLARRSRIEIEEDNRIELKKVEQEDKERWAKMLEQLNMQRIVLDDGEEDEDDEDFEDEESYEDSDDSEEDEEDSYEDEEDYEDEEEDDDVVVLN